MAVDGQRFMTKTQHYRKITKPLLERKRRARMNLYLDELKDLIVDTMEAQGEHITKLEKADILELTVNYLRTHKHEIAASAQCNTTVAAATTTTAPPPPSGLNLEKFRAGYTQAAYEVSKVFATVPGLDLKFGTRLMKHLGYQLKEVKKTPLQAGNADAVAAASTTENYSQRRKRSCDQPDFDVHNHHDEAQARGEDVWRPW